MDDPTTRLDRAELVRAVDQVIRARRTRKILDGPRVPSETPGRAPDGADRFEAAVRECLALAGLAPFHIPRGDVPEPWRFTVLFRPAMEAYRDRMGENLGGKLPQILAAAGAMVQVTWIPEEDPSRGHLEWEHAAATAAAVQTLLLAAEARGIASYWSSAKFLHTEEALAACGVPPGERYSGTVFLGHPLPPEREETEGWTGKNRAIRTAPEAGWVRIVEPGRLGR